MLVATFNATTGWAGRQITWQDDRFVLDGHGVIAAADVMHYDRQGHLDWPSEEMRSWAAARLSWEQAVTASAAVTPAAPQQVPTEAVASEPVAAGQAAAGQAASEATTAGTAVFGGSAAVQPGAAPAAADALASPAAAETVASELSPSELAAAEPAATEPPAGPAAAREPAAAAEAAAPAGPASEPTDQVRDVLVPGGDIVEVVGTAPYQEALETVAGGSAGSAPDVEKWAHLIPEPDNPWDRNAVAVYIDGRKVGYLPRESAGAYASLLGRLWAGSSSRGVCRAVVSGGWHHVQSQVGSVTSVEEGRLGVRLALAAPQHLDVTQDLKALTPEDLAAGPPPL
ncbi:MAG TPA: HIRAN domain-containing protein [Thermoleophilia bacterium]|nr:HIRAN domain-containing protein [Thermoleophilia bacterium]